MTAILEANDVSCYYGKKCAVKCASIRLEANEIVAIVGPNGAGKSSLIRGLIGLNEQITGSVSVDGVVLKRRAADQLAQNGIIMVPQEQGVFGHLSIIDNLKSSRFILKDTDKALQSLLRNAESLSPNDLKFHDRANDLALELSGGQKRILALALALASGPRAILLDEPTLGLSSRNTKAMFQAISRQRRDSSCAFMIVENRTIEVLRYSDRVYFMRMGEIIYEGMSKELLDNRALLGRLYGISA